MCCPILRGSSVLHPKTLGLGENSELVGRTKPRFIKHGPAKSTDRPRLIPRLHPTATLGFAAPLSAPHPTLSVGYSRPHTPPSKSSREHRQTTIYNVSPRRLVLPPRHARQHQPSPAFSQRTRPTEREARGVPTKIANRPSHNIHTPAPPPKPNPPSIRRRAL